MSQPLGLVQRRSGSFPGGEVGGGGGSGGGGTGGGSGGGGGGSGSGGVLSPRSESSGLGVKMVEYLLSSSPTAAPGDANQLEARMRGMALVVSGVGLREKWGI